MKGSLLGQGHAAADHVELAGQEGRDDAVITGGHQLQLDPHGLGHGLEDVDFKADDFTALVSHFERHVGRVHADFQRAALDRIVDGTGLGRSGSDHRGDAEHQHRKILFHLQDP